MEQKQTEVIEYEKPTVVDYGELAELTAGSASGRKLDHYAATSTPFTQLTFS
jgi:hypothetical protein